MGYKIKKTVQGHFVYWLKVNNLDDLDWEWKGLSNSGTPFTDYAHAEAVVKKVKAQDPLAEITIEKA